MAVCKYLRTNRTQAGIAEQFGVSQPGVSRTVSKLTLVITEALADRIPAIDDDRVCPLDGVWGSVVFMGGWFFRAV